MFILKASSRVSKSEIKWCRVPAIREPNNMLHKGDIIANLSIFRSILGKDELFRSVYSSPNLISHNTKVHPVWLPFMEARHSRPYVPLGTLCIHFAVIAAAAGGNPDRVRTFLTLASNFYRAWGSLWLVGTYTPLETAASRGHISVVDLIIDSMLNSPFWGPY
jgi:hypothetical protein